MRICDYQDPKGVRREILRQPGGGQAPPEHALEGVRRQGLTGEGTVAPLAGAKRPRVLGPASELFVQVAVHGDLPDLSSFFRKLQHPVVAVIPQILDPESEDSLDPGARMDERPQDRPVVPPRSQIRHQTPRYRTELRAMARVVDRPDVCV